LKVVIISMILGRSVFYCENGWSYKTRRRTWAQSRQETVDAIAEVEDPIDDEDSDDYEEMNAAPVCVPQRRVRGRAVAPPLVLDLGMWLNIINVKPPYHAD